MIERLAEGIAQRWTQGGVIPMEKKEIYVYGLDITISSIWITLLVAALSLVWGDILYIAFYYACFIPLRGFCGGFHARTHWGCALLQCVCFSVTALASVLIGERMPYLLMPPLFAVMLALAARFAPAEHPANPIDEDKKKTLRRGGLVALCIALPAAAALKYAGLAVYSNIVVLSSAVSITSMLFAKANTDAAEA